MGFTNGPFGGSGSSYTVNAQAAATPAAGDYLGGYDTSEAAEKKFRAEEVAALAMANPGYRANAYYLAVGNYPSNNTFTVTANRAVFQLFSICKAATFTRVGIEVTTAGAAGSKAKIGVYAAENGAPGALLHDLGEVATDGIAVVELTISLALVPGLYYLCFIPSGTPVVRRTNAEGTSLTMFYGADAISATGAVGNLYCDVGSYTLPNPAGAVSGASSLNTNPTLWLRVV